uniref:DUF5641 domain-containing protein n=1 Tax=Angiostrongylus cantonensis TaxID=6313 RepID=A0A0K0DHH5_ANGCA
MNNERGTVMTPAIGTVVLFNNPALPGNTWKMARIIDLKLSESGAIREAQLKLTNGRIIRRPINLLFLVELKDSPTQQQLGKVECGSRRLKIRKAEMKLQINAIISDLDHATTTY